MLISGFIFFSSRFFSENALVPIFPSSIVVTFSNLGDACMNEFKKVNSMRLEALA